MEEGLDYGSTRLSAGDWAVIVAYFIVVIGVGTGTTVMRRKSGHGSGNENNTEDYFLAGRSVEFWAVGASLFASNIGSEHFIGLAGSGAKVGMCVSWGEWLSPLCILVLGWMLVPFYLRAHVFTMPEFLERRYSPGLRVYYAVLLLVMYVLTKISVALYAGAVVLQQTVGFDIWTGASLLVVATGAYTAVGGMAAVIYTEVLQTLVLICGGFTLLSIAMDRVGGFDALWLQVPEQNAHLFQPPTHEDFPWTGVFLGMPFTSLWYWCTDQNVVQRVLSAKTKAHARAGTIFAGYLKILPPLMMVIPGIAARALFGAEMQAHKEGFNVAFPLLVMRLLPSPLLGLMVASMLAALMSSLASVFNSTSTIFTMDIWRKLRPNASETELVNVGRGATVITTILGLVWIPLIRLLQSGLYVYTHKMMSYLAPPVTVVFLGGIVWPRANTNGATSCLIYGLCVGLLRLFAEIMVLDSQHSHPILLEFAHSNFLLGSSVPQLGRKSSPFGCADSMRMSRHFAFIFGWSCAIVFVVASLLSEAPSSYQTKGLTLSGIELLEVPSTPDNIPLRALQEQQERHEANDTHNLPSGIDENESQSEEPSKRDGELGDFVVFPLREGETHDQNDQRRRARAARSDDSIDTSRQSGTPEASAPLTRGTNALDDANDGKPGAGTDEGDDWLMINSVASGVLLAMLLWIYCAFR